ncbi:hypothetical protein F4774DRAFT_366060 [Daldinia eschscholtzii]|nr:hypothetical protein F4774DRAFT_366060 [Daldinia eschscholtzii]
MSRRRWWGWKIWGWTGWFFLNSLFPTRKYLCWTRLDFLFRSSSLRVAPVILLSVDIILVDDIVLGVDGQVILDMGTIGDTGAIGDTRSISSMRSISDLKTTHDIWAAGGMRDTGDRLIVTNIRRATERPVKSKPSTIRSEASVFIRYRSTKISRTNKSPNLGNMVPNLRVNRAFDSLPSPPFTCPIYNSSLRILMTCVIVSARTLTRCSSFYNFGIIARVNNTSRRLW